jgi:hypothetical protein
MEWEEGRKEGRKSGNKLAGPWGVWKGCVVAVVWGGEVMAEYRTYLPSRKWAYGNLCMSRRERTTAKGMMSAGQSLRMRSELSDIRALIDGRRAVDVDGWW